MDRIVIPARPKWQERVSELGFVYHTHRASESDTGLEGTYWHEGIAYRFTEAEIDRIDEATEELHGMCMRAVNHVVSNPTLLFRFGIPSFAHEMVCRSWFNQEPHVIGRFDLGYDGKNIKMFEYNADTPTSLIEAAVVQWHWLQDVFPERAEAGKQFNLIHENLIELWRDLGAKIEKISPGSMLHFSSIKPNGMLSSIEEFATVEYLRDTATQADVPTAFEYIEDVGLGTGNVFYDTLNRPMRFWFKLYPWEWMLKEQWGEHFPHLTENTGIIEPSWKMILTNKALMPILWELNPGHPLLLPTYWDHNEKLGDRYVRKPVFGREGANVEIYRGSEKIVEGGMCADQPMIYQELFDLPRFEDSFAQIGSWVIGNKPSGIIIREDDSRLIKTSGRIVPHWFE